MSRLQKKVFSVFTTLSIRSLKCVHADKPGLDTSIITALGSTSLAPVTTILPYASWSLTFPESADWDEVIFAWLTSPSRN